MWKVLRLNDTNHFKKKYILIQKKREEYFNTEWTDGLRIQQHFLFRTTAVVTTYSKVTQGVTPLFIKSRNIIRYEEKKRQRN